MIVINVHILTVVFAIYNTFIQMDEKTFFIFVNLL